MKSSTLIGVFIVIAVLFGAAQVAHADSLCKNVSFEFKNSHNTLKPIKVTKVEYWDKEDNKWRTEDVKNIQCDPGNTCTTKGRNLEYVGNENIVKVKFHYKLGYYDSGKWYFLGLWVGGEKFPEFPYCKADKTFRKSPGQPFVIFGTN